MATKKGHLFHRCCAVLLEKVLQKKYNQNIRLGGKRCLALKGAIICIANNAALSTNQRVGSVQYAVKKLWLMPKDAPRPPLKVQKAIISACNTLLCEEVTS